MRLIRYLDAETAQKLLHEETFSAPSVPGAQVPIVPRIGEHVRIRPKYSTTYAAYVVVGVMHDLGHGVIEVFLKGPV